MDIIEQKIIDFFERFSTQTQTKAEDIKLIIQLIDNSTTNLTPLYSAHTKNIDKYMLISEIIYLGALEKIAVSYTTINNKIGKFFDKKATELNANISSLKGCIVIRNGKPKAYLFLDGKMQKEFSIKDFTN